MRRITGFSETIAASQALIVWFFFFQAEDGIRDLTVTGVQTCALPISTASSTPEGDAFTFVSGVEEAVERAREAAGDKDVHVMGGADVIRQTLDAGLEIGRASCRERV